MEPPEIHSLLDLSGRVAVVTGGGSGLGTGIAQRFAAAGASVVVGYHSSADGAQRVVEAIHAEGGSAIAVAADVTLEERVDELLDAALASFGSLDVLVNNAGMYPLVRLVEMSTDQWDETVDANLKSVFLTTRAFARRVIAAKQPGAIVNIASIEAENAAPMHSHYNAAKAGVVMHTQAAAQELGPHLIRVNAVSPGLIWREGLDEAWPEGVARYREAAPLGRLGRADDVGDACLFLASAASRWITGANLRVDGGVMTTQIF